MIFILKKIIEIDNFFPCYSQNNAELGDQVDKTLQF